MTNLYSPTDVAKMLNVSVETARQIISQLPHICVSKDANSKKPRLRITEETLTAYLSGNIERVNAVNLKQKISRNPIYISGMKIPYRK